VQTLLDAVKLARETANAYDALLERLLITEQLPAWSNNHLNRLVRLPKRYLIDPGLIGPLLGVDQHAVLRNDDLLGRIIDTFVVAQLRAECAISEYSPHLFHVRDANGRHEVDVLIECADGRVIGIEIKADAAPGQAEAAHLRWLRDAIGDKFALGIVMHTGPRPFRLDDSILALPIYVLWS
jgi:predicted AAA+ superfamily ATPase